MKILLCISILVSTAFASEMVEVAITVDDLPASGGDQPGISRTQVAEQMIRVLKQHKVPGVYGFVNGILAKNMVERLNILKLWKKAGFKLGNHTYSHKDLSEVTAEQFIKDIEDNESMLIDYVSNIKELKYLRYPFLHEGESKDKRYAIRGYLARRNYRVAPVSIDFQDWVFGPAYIRCSAANKTSDRHKVEDLFHDKAVALFKYYIEVGRKIYGYERKIKHILLLHMTSLSAHQLDDLLTSYENLGAKWIDFETAASDPIYQEDTSYWGEVGKTFLDQAQESRKLVLKDLPTPQIPREELEKYCL